MAEKKRSARTFEMAAACEEWHIFIVSEHFLSFQLSALGKAILIHSDASGLGDILSLFYFSQTADCYP